MRVLFDGYWWGAGPVSNRQVLRELVLAWIEEFPADDAAVAVRREHVDAARAELPERVDVLGTRLTPQGVGAIIELPFVARRWRADVTVTHNFTPLFGTAAVFIHDYLFRTSPEWFTAKERAYFALMPLTAPRARHLFTSSRAEADRISRLSRGRTVTPIGLALGRGLRDAEPRRPRDLDDDLDGFLLTVGRLNARKNLALTIEAAVNSGRVRASRPLLIVGEPQGRSATLSDVVERAVESGAVRFLGYLDDAELAWLYGHADALLFLTRDEGFGLPALEAVHFGAPVIASDIPVFHETLGDRAALVDPTDVEAIAHAIRDLGPRPGAVDTRDLGYSWPESVRRMRAVLTGAST